MLFSNSSDQPPFITNLIEMISFEGGGGSEVDFHSLINYYRE